MLKKKKTMTSGELIIVKSVPRTRSRRMKFCVHGGGLEGYLQQAAPEAEWLSRGIACQYYQKCMAVCGDAT